MGVHPAEATPATMVVSVPSRFPPVQLGPVPSTQKFTVPVIVPATLEVTVAVRVVALPTTTGFGEAESDVDVAAGVIVTVRFSDCELAKFVFDGENAANTVYAVPEAGMLAGAGAIVDAVPPETVAVVIAIGTAPPAW